MAMLRPSLTLVLDLDERLAQEETKLEVKREYAHITTPVLREHAPESEDAPYHNVMRCMVNMGAHNYLMSTDSDADDNWNNIMDPWVGNLFYRVGNNMKVFNDRQREIGLPELIFDRLSLELQGGSFEVAVHPDAWCLVDKDLHSQVTRARQLLNSGALEGATGVDLPTDESYALQYAEAKALWDEEHPDAEPAKGSDEEAVSCDAEQTANADDAPVEVREKTREELLREDAEAKSYENTAVPPTDSATLPPVSGAEGEEEEEEERFNFEVDYTLWKVHFADGSERVYDSSVDSFVE